MSFTSPHFDHITVIGLGLIGGGLVSLIRETYDNDTLKITAVDRDEKTLQLALKMNLVNRVSREIPQHFTGKHLVILATHLYSNETLLKEIAARIESDSDVLVTDIGSVKQPITSLGHELLPDNFIGGHPMAGREKQGLEHATSLMFFKRRFLITPHEQFCNEKLLDRFIQFLSTIQMIPVTLTPAKHDLNMAYVSHLPQLYAVVLTNLLATHRPGELLQFQGGGIDDQLRLAASPAEMWAPVYEQNAANMRIVMDEMIGVLQTMRDGLDDVEHMSEWFKTSNTIHRAYEQIKRNAQQASASVNTLL